MVTAQNSSAVVEPVSPQSKAASLLYSWGLLLGGWWCCVWITPMARGQMLWLVKWSTHPCDILSFPSGVLGSRE